MTALRTYFTALRRLCEQFRADGERAARAGKPPMSENSVLAWAHTRLDAEDIGRLLHQAWMHGYREAGKE